MTRMGRSLRFGSSGRTARSTRSTAFSRSAAFPPRPCIPVICFMCGFKDKSATSATTADGISMCTIKRESAPGAVSRFYDTSLFRVCQCCKFCQKSGRKSSIVPATRITTQIKRMMTTATQPPAARSAEVSRIELTNEFWGQNSVLAEICPTPITPCRIYHHISILKRKAKKEKAL